LGDEVVVVLVFVSPSSVLVVVLLSVLFEEEGSFTTVVLFSVLFSPGGLTVVVSLFSHAANKATPANMMTYFFMKIGELIATEG
jgi:hypothetical protein